LYGGEELKVPIARQPLAAVAPMAAVGATPPSLAELQRYLDQLPIPEVKDLSWIYQMNSIDNYMAFHEDEIDWGEIDPQDLASAYVTVIQAGIPYASAFLDKVEFILADYMLDRVLPDWLLAALTKAATERCPAYLSRTPGVSFLKALARPRSNKGLIDFHLPDAQVPDPTSGLVGAQPESEADYQWGLKHRIMFDDHGNRLPGNNALLLDKTVNAGPAGLLTLLIAMLRGEDMDDLLVNMEMAEALDGVLAATSDMVYPRMSITKDPAPTRGRKRPRAPRRRGRPLLPDPPRFPVTSGSVRELPDISGRFNSRSYRLGKSLFKEIRGWLGVPGQVATHDVRQSTKWDVGTPGSGDDAGHMARRQFGAPGDAFNLGAQNRIQNRVGGTWHTLEEYWKARLLAGYDIEVRIRDRYRLGETRPFSREAEWLEIGPDGTRTTGSGVFANPQTPESRQKQGIPATVLPPGYMAPVLPLEVWRQRLRR
jgi:hypothetical protein